MADKIAYTDKKVGPFPVVKNAYGHVYKWQTMRPRNLFHARGAAKSIFMSFLNFHVKDYLTRSKLWKINGYKIIRYLSQKLFKHFFLIAVFGRYILMN